MKRFRITLILLIGFGSIYAVSYSILRLRHDIVRARGKWGHYIISEPIVATAFYPAWLVERKARSAWWRISNKKPLFGHVYWDGTEEPYY